MKFKKNLFCFLLLSFVFLNETASAKRKKENLLSLFEEPWFVVEAQGTSPKEGINIAQKKITAKFVAQEEAYQIMKEGIFSLYIDSSFSVTVKDLTETVPRLEKELEKIIRTESVISDCNYVADTIAYLTLQLSSKRVARVIYKYLYKFPPIPKWAKNTILKVSANVNFYSEDSDEREIERKTKELARGAVLEKMKEEVFSFLKSKNEKIKSWLEKDESAGNEISRQIIKNSKIQYKIDIQTKEIEATGKLAFKNLLKDISGKFPLFCWMLYVTEKEPKIQDEEKIF